MHCCKSILGVRSQTNNNFVYGELGRYPLRIRRNKRVIKVGKCTSTNYLKHIYNVMLQEMNMYPNRNSWGKSVKTVIENLGFYNVWLNQGVVYESLFLKMFEQLLGDNY